LTIYLSVGIMAPGDKYMDIEVLEPIAEALLDAVKRRDEAALRQAMGALMGTMKSPKKAAASRQNGQLGGRHKGYTHSEETRARMAESQRRRIQARQMNKS
jgi:hypothetical protein